MPLTLNAVSVRAEAADLLAEKLTWCGLVPAEAGRSYRTSADVTWPPLGLFSRPGMADDYRPTSAVVVHALGEGRLRAAWATNDADDRYGLIAALGLAGTKLVGQVWRASLVRTLRACLTLAGIGCGVTCYELSSAGDAFLFSCHHHEDDKMQMPTTVRVTIDPQGTPKIEVVGGQGSSCLAATKRLVDSLGVEVTQELKPEFYQAPLTEEQVVTAGAT